MKNILYGIDYRNMHNAIHGLIIYEDRAMAENAVEDIKELERLINRFEMGTVKDKTREDIQEIYDSVVSKIFNKADILIEEINYRDIVWVQKYGKNKREYNKRVDDKIVRVINLSYDLYV